MKKNLTLLSIILISIISFKAQAQDDVDNKAKTYLSLFGGVSTPLGDFASTNYSNNSAGFAKRGVTFGLEGAAYLYKNLALGWLISFQDQGELTTADAQNLANGYNESFNKNQTVVTAVGRYHNINLLLGPQYSFLYKKFTLDIKAEAGLIKSFATPSISYVFDNSSGSATTQLSSKGVTFAYGASTGIRYSLGDSWDVGIKANYINSQGIKIENANTVAGTGRLVTNQPISEIQTTLGIALKF
ncbi:MAG TPA: hypothetical protein VGN20_23015 [Mucilaginibacter sp.]